MELFVELMFIDNYSRLQRHIEHKSRLAVGQKYAEQQQKKQTRDYEQKDQTGVF
jgi:hypothetical protein